ncbi:hypothetical protein PoB_001520100 [Plakobranchus ocellatus]|uniref:Uncharacterized protein n=1 Tax=Plakobranchus ocellatus TaxID=259542 RepID=A0AAV3YYR2_9GAST|nr:hypothetical protein PoB_001520100 [Plakobranchus ocellatus]
MGCLSMSSQQQRTAIADKMWENQSQVQNHSAEEIQAENRDDISIFWSPLGLALMSERTCNVAPKLILGCVRSQLRHTNAMGFQRDCTFLRLCWWYSNPRAPDREHNKLLCTLFLSSSRPLTPVSAAVVSRPRQAKDTISI